MKAIELKKLKISKESDIIKDYAKPILCSDKLFQGNRKRANFFSCHGLPCVSLLEIGLQSCWVHKNRSASDYHLFVKEKGFFASNRYFFSS